MIKGLESDRQGEAERAAAIQLPAEKARGNSTNKYKYLIWAYKDDRAWLIVCTVAG